MSLTRFSLVGVVGTACTCVHPSCVIIMIARHFVGGQMGYSAYRVLESCQMLSREYHQTCVAAIPVAWTPIRCGTLTVCVHHWQCEADAGVLLSD